MNTIDNTDWVERAEYWYDAFHQAKTAQERAERDRDEMQELLQRSCEQRAALRDELITAEEAVRRLMDAASATSTAIPAIPCPACGTTVTQRASATLGLALSQHYRWVCPYGPKQKSGV